MNICHKYMIISLLMTVKPLILITADVFTLIQRKIHKSVCNCNVIVNINAAMEKYNLMSIIYKCGFLLKKM